MTVLCSLDAQVFCLKYHKAANLLKQAPVVQSLEIKRLNYEKAADKYVCVFLKDICLIQYAPLAPALMTHHAHTAQQLPQSLMGNEKKKRKGSWWSSPGRRT